MELAGHTLDGLEMVSVTDLEVVANAETPVSRNVTLDAPMGLVVGPARLKICVPSLTSLGKFADDK